MPSSSRARPKCVGVFSGEFLGQRPMRIVALKDVVAITVKTQRDALSGDHGVQGAQITNGIFRLQLKLRGQDPAAAISASTTFLRRSQFGSSQNAPHRFAAER